MSAFEIVEIDRIRPLFPAKRIPHAFLIAVSVQNMHRRSKRRMIGMAERLKRSVVRSERRQEKVHHFPVLCQFFGYSAKLNEMVEKCVILLVRHLLPLNMGRLYR